MLGSIGTPVLLLPLALAHGSRKVEGRRVSAAMVGAGGAALAWTLAGRGAPWLGIEPIFPGLLVSALALVPAWRRQGAAAPRRA